MNRLRLMLLPFSAVYSAAIFVRNMLFDMNVLQSATVEKPVLSVGNISAGGVGKTPLVELIIDELRTRIPVGIVSRGYGRKSHGTIVVRDGSRSLADVHEAGDELRQMADRFTDTIVVADERRVRGARMAIALGAQVVVLDDAFQHRYLHRDLDIVVMTAKHVLRGEIPLPAGNRREPLRAVRRAHLIAVTRCIDEAQMNEIERLLQRWNKPVLCLRTRIRSVTHIASQTAQTEEAFSGKNVVAFSGIGSPESFDTIMKQMNANVIHHFRFRDHHWYTEKDLNSIRAKAESNNVEALLTTEKDAARLQYGIGAPFLDAMPVYSVGVTHELARGGASLQTLLTRLIL